MESLPLQVFTFSTTALLSYLTIIYCSRYSPRKKCKLCTISKEIKKEYNEIQKYTNLRRSKRLAEKINKPRYK